MFFIYYIQYVAYIGPNERMFKEELRTVLFQFLPHVPFDDGDVVLLL